ncbi:MAG: mannitol dehydrogenase [Defluviitaleaceae bacterium]|nr:mannitol dehydrogenase [Defluviitaleaceae bacterium]
MKFLMYGAGSIGRGFIGPLFVHAGYEVVFVDINQGVIHALNSRGSYHYTITAGPHIDIQVNGVRCIDGRDREAVLKEIASCDLMATSLGGDVLKKVVPIIAEGFSLRMKLSGRPLNILICENLKNAAILLGEWMVECLHHEDRLLLSEKCGLIEAAIGRMVPQTASDADDPLYVTVEEYCFLPVDKDAFVGELPKVEGLVPYSPFSFYEERKLYLHNMGHAICAYMGMRHGYETIAEAIQDFTVRFFVQSAMIESSAMLSAKYGISFNKIFDHAEDLLLRFGNTALGDTCERVGRDPMRKLKAGDRLAGALTQCSQMGVLPIYIALGYGVALRNITDDASEAANIAREIGGLPEDLARIVDKMFLATNHPAQEFLQITERMKKELRGDIV